MIETLTLFLSGCVFGLAGGFSPGPTTTLVVAQSVRFGMKDGFKVAIAPALTDAPIIAVAVFFIGRLARFEPVLGVISLLGAAFLVYLAVDGFRTRELKTDAIVTESQSMRKGFLANLLNPHPYLFWFVIGAPRLLEAWNNGPITAAAFIMGLYTCLVGAKMLLAVLAAKSSQFLKSRGYLYVNRALGIALGVFAVVFLRDGLRFLGLLSS